MNALKYIFGLLAFLLIIVGIGGVVDWHPVYTALLTLFGIFAGLRIISEIPDVIRDLIASMIASKKAETLAKNAAMEPLLIGGDEAASGEIALGWLIGKNKKTMRKTAQLKTVNQNDRASHFYVVGASGMGKTKFLESLILQDAKNKVGFGIIDPHGDLIEEVKIHLAHGMRMQEKERGVRWLMTNVVLIDPTDPAVTASFNPLELMPGDSSAKLAGELTTVFKKIWSDSWGPRLEDLLRNSFVALSESGLTLADLPDFLTKTKFREKALGRVKNEMCVARFRQFDSQSDAARNAWIEPVLNKVNALLLDDRVRQLFSSPRSTFNLREVMDSEKILLVKLNRGELTGYADLLGSLLLAKIQMAAFSRTDTKEERKRVPFYLYIDEFQNFATENFLETLAEARKYRLYLILAHQNLSQLPERLQASILANSGVQVYFRTSHQDANTLSKESGERPADGPGWKDLKKQFKDPREIFFQPYNLRGQRWGERAQLLQELAPRWCVVKNKKEKGAVLIKTDTIPDLVKEYSTMFSEKETDEMREEVNSTIGAAYLRKRQDIELERRKRSDENENKEDEDPETFREAKTTGDLER